MNHNPDRFRNENETLNFRQVIILARKWAWLFAASTVIFAIAGFGVSRILPPVYQARTVLLIKELPTASVNDYTAILMSEREAQMYVEMILNRPLLQKVAEGLNQVVSAEEIAQATQVERIRDTRLIALIVETKGPNLAAEIANGIATEFSQQLLALENTTFQSSKANIENQLNVIDEQMQSIEKKLDELAPEDNLERSRLSTSLDEYQRTYADLILKYEDIRLAEAATTSGIYQLEPAVANQNPVRPQVGLNTFLAAVFGLVLAGVVVFLIEATDDTLRTQEDIEQYLQLPILGVIPSYITQAGKPVTLAEPRSPISDAYRTLKTNIQFASVDRSLKTILITSTSPGEGKSTLAINLSIIMAQSKGRTVLVDTDFRRPQISNYLGLSNLHGLSDIFAEDGIALDDKFQCLDSLAVEVLSAGKIPPNPTELLGSEKMAHVLDATGARAEIVIVDTPPLMVVSDAVILAKDMDGIMLVVKPGLTHTGAAQKAIEQLRRAQANILGVVLNDVDVKRDGYYSGYYHYHKYYETGGKRPGILARWKKRKTV